MRRLPYLLCMLILSTVLLLLPIEATTLAADAPATPPGWPSVAGTVSTTPPASSVEDPGVAKSAVATRGS